MGSPSALAWNYIGRGNITLPAVQAKVLKDLATFWDSGIRTIRTGCPPYTFSGDPQELANGATAIGLAERRLFAKFVKNFGFRVIHGITDISSSNVTHGSTQWLNYLNGYVDSNGMSRGIEAEATWAQANDMDDLTIGNEMGNHVNYSAIDTDNTTYPTTEDKNVAKGAIRSQIRDEMRDAAIAAKAIFTNGPVCISVSEGESVHTYGGGWVSDQPAHGMSGFDRIDFNMYGLLSEYQSHLIRNIAAFGANNIGLTEINSDDGYSNMNSFGVLGSPYQVYGREEERFSQDLVRRVAFAQTMGINPICLFSLNQFATSYALRNDATNNYRLAYGDILAKMNGEEQKYAL